MKQYYCQSCESDKDETIGCKAQQLKWDCEDVYMKIPIVGSKFTEEGYSYCRFFRPVELEEKE